MKNVILVRGFNTSVTETRDDIYQPFKLFFSNSNEYTLEYFDYPTYENLDDVYNRLKQIVNRFDIIIGHSMGAYLTNKLLLEGIIDTTTKKVITINPPVFYNVFQTTLAKIPNIGNLYLPVFLIISSAALFSNGNFLNNDYSLIVFKQAMAMINNLLDITKLSAIINNSNNIYMMYSKKDTVTVFPSSYVSLFTPDKLIHVDGLHQPFSEWSKNNDLFDKLSLILSKSII